MLQKNTTLLVNICAVQLKSAHGSVFPSLEEIYTSLSKIKWSSDSQKSAAGIQYKNQLVLSYPGLSSDQFRKLDELISGLYEVRIGIVDPYLPYSSEIDNLEWYQVAEESNPMEVDCRFNGGSTEIILSNNSFEPPKYVGFQEGIGFPYTFNLNLV